jgi:hypothetical protein
MMRIRAKVQNVTGQTAHMLGVPTHRGVETLRLPDPTAVEIVDQDGAFYLLRLDLDGKCLSDTWHETLVAAKEQAAFEFGIKMDDWEEKI